MSKNEIMTELPSYLKIDTTDGLKIEIDTEEYLDSLPTSELINNLENRCDYNPLEDAYEYDLVDELKDRHHDFTMDVNNEEIAQAYYDRNIMKNSEYCFSLMDIARCMSPRRHMDKKTLKEIINEIIDCYY